MMWSLLVASGYSWALLLTKMQILCSSPCTGPLRFSLVFHLVFSGASSPSGFQIRIIRTSASSDGWLCSPEDLSLCTEPIWSITTEPEVWPPSCYRWLQACSGARRDGASIIRCRTFLTRFGWISQENYSVDTSICIFVHQHLRHGVANAKKLIGKLFSKIEIFLFLSKNALKHCQMITRFQQKLRCGSFWSLSYLHWLELKFRLTRLILQRLDLEPLSWLELSWSGRTISAVGGKKPDTNKITTKMIQTWLTREKVIPKPISLSLTKSFSWTRLDVMDELVSLQNLKEIRCKRKQDHFPHQW